LSSNVTNLHLFQTDGGNGASVLQQTLSLMMTAVAMVYVL